MRNGNEKEGIVTGGKTLQETPGFCKLFKHLISTMNG